MIAKRLGSPYLPGSRDGVVKVKPYKTADCVIVGFRWSDKADGRISTLLLGLYGDDGELDFVGPLLRLPGARCGRELEAELPTAARAGVPERQADPGRPEPLVAGQELDWNPVRPELVCEVRYDKLEGNRFRHGTKLPPLPAGQGPERLHVARGQAAAPPRRPDRRITSWRGLSAAALGDGAGRPARSASAELSRGVGPNRASSDPPARGRACGKSGIRLRLYRHMPLRQVADLVDPLAHRRQREPLRLDGRAPRPSRAAPRPARRASGRIE